MIVTRDEGQWTTWTEGRNYCIDELGTDYFSINSGEKQQKVEEVAEDNSVEYPAWTGFTDDSQFSTGLYISSPFLKARCPFFPNWKKKRT